MAFQMIGSNAFAELGIFPLDPTDYTVLKENVRPDKLNFYVRVFFDGQFNTVLMLDDVRSVMASWQALAQRFGSVTPQIADILLTEVYQTFSVIDNPPNVERGKLAAKMLCLHHLPALQNNIKPYENVVGMILQFRARKLLEWCYCRFALIDINDMIPRLH